MARPQLQVTSVTIGTSQPHELARFYARLLDYDVTALDPPGPDEPEHGGWAQAKPKDGGFPILNFEFERCFRRPVWPAKPGEQTASEHLDIHVEDLEASVAWAVECGAVLDPFQPQEHVRVMRDPDGHPFCLFL
jgi:catechol 2,3-dioxygenase-like lactoylglutathione lyase family enzyme